jgi:hypothetical protein
MKYRIALKIFLNGKPKYFRWNISKPGGRMVDAIAEGRERVEKKHKGANVSLVSASPILSPEDF